MESKAEVQAVEIRDILRTFLDPGKIEDSVLVLLAFYVLYLKEKAFYVFTSRHLNDE